MWTMKDGTRIRLGSGPRSSSSHTAPSPTRGLEVTLSTGLITAITSVYDFRQIDPASKRSLIDASAG